MIKVALDAMGGDNAPGEIVKGAVDAVNTSKECFVYLVGKEDVVNNELSKYTYSKEQIEVVNATEVIETFFACIYGIYRTFNNLARGIISTHSIKCNFYHKYTIPYINYAF